MASSRKYLPTPVEKLLSDFTAQSFPFTWNIQNNGVTVSLNVSWTVADQNRIPVRILQNKAPSTLKRDKERMTEFMLRKDESNMKNASNKMQVSSVSCSPTAKTTNSLSTQTTSILSASVSVQTLQSSFLATTDRGSVCNFKPEVKNSTVQTYNVPCMTIHTQTDKITSENENLQPSKFSGNDRDRCTVKQTEAVLKRRIKGEQVEYLVKWQNLPANKNTWIAENKLDSAALAIIEKNPDQLRGPVTSRSSQYRNTRFEDRSCVARRNRVSEPTVDVRRRKTADIVVPTVDVHGKAVDVVEILSVDNRHDDPYEISYTVRCANGCIAEVPILSTPPEFEEILQWKWH